MPELPEVETIKRSLAINIGALIDEVLVIREDMLRRREYEPQEIQGNVIQGFSRRGKYLQIDIEKGYIVLVHMGMSGRFYMVEEDEPIDDKHVHFIIRLHNGKKLLFQDPRRFGGVWLLKSTATIYARLGREPLSRSFNKAYLQKVLKNRQAPVKNIILNQNLISGIGNIYADEALFLAGIRPDRKAGTLIEKEISNLCYAIKKVLQEGIKYRGTTFRDYRDGNNRSGGFQEHLKVYGKKGEKCPACGTPLRMTRIGGRSSHYCANCQK